MDHATLRSYRLGDWQAMHALDLLCFEPVFRFSRGDASACLHRQHRRHPLLRVDRLFADVRG